MNYGTPGKTARKVASSAAALGERSKPAAKAPTGSANMVSSTMATRAIPLFAKRINPKELTGLTSQLAIMTRSGVDIASALESLARRCKHPTLRFVLEEVHENVLSGHSLSESMAQYSTVFSEMFVASVAAGEASGRLPDVLQQLSVLLRGQLKLRNSLRAMLAYPVLLVGVSTLVLSALIVFVLPRFAEIFAEFDAPLPVMTQVLLAVSGEIRARYWLWFPLFFAAAVGGWVFRRGTTGTRLWDTAMLYLPVANDVTRNLLMGRACRLLGLMIESGIPLMESLRLTRMSIRNVTFRELFVRLEDDVLNGRGLSVGISDCPYVPGAASEMIMTAEKTGALGPVTTMMGQHFEEEGEAKLKELVAIAEPLITVVMGFLVAVIVMSVMLPLFDLSSAAGKG